MNKTIIINISGVIFHIEEDAYEVLKNYMNDVKRHFSNSEDSFEIITDIENRVAEMFSDLLKKENRQVLIPADIHYLIERMGKVADFEETSTKEETYSKPETKRKLFRNPDDKIIGGVCSGIANYFDADPVWIRLALAVLFFIFGTGFLLYVLLWIIVPVAKTRSEKMQMKGQKLDLSGITQSVKEELGDLRRNFNSAGTLIVPAGDKVKNFVQELVELILRVLGGLVRLIAVIASVLFLFIGFIGIIALIAVFLAALNVYPSNFQDFFPLQLADNSLQTFSTVSVAFTAIIPLIAIFLISIKILFKNAYINRKLALYLLLFWIVSLTFTGYSASQIAKDFKEEGKLEKSETLLESKNKVYYLNLNELTPFSSEDSTTINLNLFGEKKTKVLRGNMANSDFNRVEIKIKMSEDNLSTIVSTASAHGNTLSDAIQNAEKIQYNYTLQDSIITFDPIFTFTQKSLNRKQELEITLKIPENTRLIINGNLDRYLNNISLWECKHDENRDFKDQKTEWMMTRNGLVCKEKRIENTNIEQVDSTRNQ